MHNRAFFFLGSLTALLVVLVPISHSQGDEKQTIKVDQAALKRTREQVQMLDTLYKTAVVGITKTYVNQQADTPAALVAAEIFDVMKKNKFHNARLVDASGKPKNRDNVAQTEFEKQAVEAIKGGKTQFEQIGMKDGQAVLRTGTIVPAVMKQCASCHRVKEGDLLGVIVYELPVK